MTTLYVDTDRFNGHEKMIEELRAAGYTVITNISEAELIHQYDITFLVNRYDFVEESRRYRPSGTRISSGKYKGQFPYIPKGMPGTYNK